MPVTSLLTSAISTVTASILQRGSRPLPSQVTYLLQILFATSFWVIRTSPSRTEGGTDSRTLNLRFRSFASRVPRSKKHFLSCGACGSPRADISHFFQHLVRSSWSPHWSSQRLSAHCRFGVPKARIL